MAGQQRKLEGEPLVEALALLGPHDRRCAQPQRDARGRKFLAQRMYAGQRRRGVTQERIEHDLRGAASRGFARGLDIADDRAQRERLLRDRRGDRRGDRLHDLADTRFAHRSIALTRPAELLVKLRDGILPNAIQFTDRQKQAFG